MDVWSLDLNDSKGMIREKGEFMLGLCEQCMGESLNSRQKSIIDRCVRKLYIEIARNREKYVPIMSDFYEILMNQPEDEARDIALSLELFVNGSLNIFNVIPVHKPPCFLTFFQSCCKYFAEYSEFNSTWNSSI